MTALTAFIALFTLGHVSSWAAADLEEGVKDLAGKITKSMVEKGTRKIAIVDFSDLNRNVTALGQFMAEELTTGRVAASVSYSSPPQTAIMAEANNFRFPFEAARGAASVLPVHSR